MNISATRGRGRRPLPGLAAAVGMALIVPLAGCDVDQLLDVDDPEFPTGLSPVVITAGAVGDFQRAYGGSAGALHDEGYITMSAAFSDEVIAGGTFTTRIALDQRILQPTDQGNHSNSAFNQLQRARRALADAAATVEEVDGATAPLRGEMLALEGFTTVALGEGWCGAVPFSEAVDAPGEPLGTMAIFERAAQRFNSALATDGFENLARVGLARAHLNRGEYAEAAAAAAPVPTSFVYFIEHSDNTGRQRNPWYALQDNGRWSMANAQGGGVAYRNGDPRTPWVACVLDTPEDCVAFDGITPQFTSLRAPRRHSNQVLADGIEARLIQAEAAIHTGGDWLGMLNELRANYRSLMSARVEGYEGFLEAGTRTDVEYFDLDPLTDPGNDAARVDMLFEERARWLYNSGHRLGDLRRLVRNYGRNQADVFPSGEYHKDGSFGNDVSLPIPFDEINNPLYRDAGGHDLCDTTQA